MDFEDEDDADDQEEVVEVTKKKSKKKVSDDAFRVSEAGKKGRKSLAERERESEGSETGLHSKGIVRLHHTVFVQCEALTCQFSPDGRYLAVGLITGIIRIYDGPVLKCVNVLADPDIENMKLPVTCLKFRPMRVVGGHFRHLIGVTYASGFVKLWQMTSRKCISSVFEDRQPLTLAFSEDGRKMATSGSNALIYIYDLEIKSPINTLGPSDEDEKMDGHKLRVFQVLYHPLENTTLVSGGWDRVIHIWDDRQKHSIRSIYGPNICGDGIDIDPAKNILLTASWSKRHSLQMWDFKTGEKIRDINPDSYTSMLYSGQFIRSDFIVSSGSDTNLIRVIERLTYMTVGVLVNLPKAVFTFSHNQIYVNPKIAAISGNSIYILDLLPGRLQSEID